MGISLIKKSPLVAEGSRSPQQIKPLGDGDK